MGQQEYIFYMYCYFLQFFLDFVNFHPRFINIAAVFCIQVMSNLDNITTSAALLNKKTRQAKKKSLASGNRPGEKETNEEKIISRENRLKKLICGRPGEDVCRQTHFRKQEYYFFLVGPKSKEEQKKASDIKCFLEKFAC